MMRTSLTGLFTVLGITTGCTKTTTTTLAPYERNSPPIMAVVRDSAAYDIRYQSPDMKHPQRLDGPDARIAFITGDKIGFRTREDGVLIAMLPYGQEQPLPEIPTDVSRVMFTTRVRKPTQFARSAGKTITAAGILGLGAAAAGMVGTGAYLDYRYDRSDDGSDSDSPPSLRHHSQH